MPVAIWIVAAISLGSLAVMVVLVLRAPAGYEDGKGFHYGKPAEPETRSAADEDDIAA